MVDDVSEFAGFRFFLGPRDPAHAARIQPCLPLHGDGGAARPVSIDLSALNPLDFGFGEVPSTP